MVVDTTLASTGEEKLGMTLHYKAKMTKDTNFSLQMYSFADNLTINPNYFQVGYTTFGPGHPFTKLQTPFNLN